jgi:hypothetical protein
MKQGSTFFLRTAVILLGISVLAVCVFALPSAFMSDGTGYYRPILVGMYLPAIPFFLALYEALKLLNFIDRNKVFSKPSIRALGVIKYCALAVSGLYAAGMPYIFYAADRDDAPGVILVGLVIIGAAFVVATFAAVLQKLLQNAVDIKSENDLTV